MLNHQKIPLSSLTLNSDKEPPHINKTRFVHSNLCVCAKLALKLSPVYLYMKALEQSRVLPVLVLNLLYLYMV